MEKANRLRRYKVLLRVAFGFGLAALCCVLVSYYYDQNLRSVVPWYSKNGIKSRLLLLAGIGFFGTAVTVTLIAIDEKKAQE